MGNYREMYNSYSTGYDPKAVEHDLLTIRQLMKGRKKITMQLAQEIYYKIKSENIQFHSDTGEDFLHKLLQNMTQAAIASYNFVESLRGTCFFPDSPIPIRHSFLSLIGALFYLA